MFNSENLPHLSKRLINMATLTSKQTFNNLLIYEDFKFSENDFRKVHYYLILLYSSLIDNLITTHCNSKNINPASLITPFLLETRRILENCYENNSDARKLHESFLIEYNGFKLNVKKHMQIEYNKTIEEYFINYVKNAVFEFDSKVQDIKSIYNEKNKNITKIFALDITKNATSFFTYILEEFFKDDEYN